MELILLLVLFGFGLFVFLAAKKLRLTQKQRVRKQLVKELRRSGKLRKESDALHLKLAKKNRELLESKDRSVELMRQFVGLALIKSNSLGSNVKCSK